jgi:hypothetical protein
MKTFQQFQESIEQRRQQIAQKQKDAADSFKSRAKQYTADLQAKRDAEEDRKRMKDEIKQELANEVYDPEIQGRSQIRKTGEGGRIGRERKKSTPEIRRTKAVGGGKTEPVSYKPRKDIGTQRQASTRVQQPEQERGSAREKQLAAAKEERRKAAQARIAATKSGGTVSAAKPKAKEAEKKASELLRKKAPEKAPAADYTPRKASGLSTQERKALYKKGERELRDLVLTSTGKKSEKELQHKYTSK